MTRHFRSGALSLSLLLASLFAAGAVFTTPPTATIAHWRGNATAAYTIIHDDACDGSLGPPAYGTYGLYTYWNEGAKRGLPIAFATTTRECSTNSPGRELVEDAYASGYEIQSHSWFHCDHTDAPQDCVIWDATANGGAGDLVPLTAVHPEIDTREKLLDYEMGQSRAWLQGNITGGAPVSFYVFPFDLWDATALGRLTLAGYLGARGGDRDFVTLNTWSINPDSAGDPGYDPDVDSKVAFDEYNANDVQGSPSNTSRYDPPSLTTYLSAVVSNAAWGVQGLHGIEDGSFGTVAITTYRSHLDSVTSMRNAETLWVTGAAEAIRYRRTNYHCGGARNGADAVVAIDINGDLTFTGLADPKCATYATEVTIVVTLPAGIDAITATQNGVRIGVRAHPSAAGKVLLDVNPALGQVNVQPAASPTSPAITSAGSATFAYGLPGSFTLTATGSPAPMFFMAGNPPPGLGLDAATGVISGTPTMAGTFTRLVTAATSFAPNATQTLTITVHKGDQAIAFPTPAAINVNEVASLSATSGSGLEVAFASVTPGICTVSVQDVTVTGAAVGACTIEATQAGDGNWNAAPSVKRTFPVMGTQSIQFGAAPTVVVGATGNVTATASSSLPVSFTSWIPEICTIVGNVVTGRATGTCTIAANQPGNEFYHPANQVTQSFVIGKGSQTITFLPVADIAVGASAALVASGGASGMAVTFASLTPATCSVSGTTVTGIARGTCTVAANQAGNANYNAAPQVTRTLQVTAGLPQTITFGPAPTLAVGGAGLLSASASSGLPVTFSSKTPATCSVSGHTVAGLAAGACTVAANQGGNAIYAAAQEATQGIVVGKGSQAIAFAPVADIGVGAHVTLAVTGGASGMPVALASMTPIVCSVSGTTATGLARGTCTVSADQAGNANYHPAPQVSRSFQVVGLSQTIAFGSPPSVVVGGTGTLSAAASSGLPVVFGSVTPGTCSVSGSVVTGLAAGSCTITANQAGNGIYSPAPQATQIFAIGAGLDAARLVGISTRGAVLTGDDVMIGGFVIGGSAPKTVMVRARGPSLADSGIAAPLADPLLRLFSGSALIGSNDDWQAAPNAPQILASGFAPANGAESAILATLQPGGYTAIVSAADGRTGVGLVEVYEVDRVDVPLIGIATRGRVLAGDGVMIVGFVVAGAAPQTVVIRARGSSLAANGILGVLADPRLTLVPASGPALTNDDWRTAANAASLEASGFAPPDDREAAILVTLAPGAYTAIVNGAPNASGVAIVEVYRVQ